MSHPDAFSLRRDFMLGKASAPIYALEDAAALSRCACAVAIGAFDGVHRGHRHLIDQMVADAHERGIAAIAVTFDPDPDTVVSAAPAPKLTLVADRLRLLASSGVDAVCVVPFDSALASLDHDAFFTRVLLPVLDIRSVHVGSNFRLGYRGASDVNVIRDWACSRGIEVFGHELVCDDGDVVSATRIRSLISSGSMEMAAAELGRTYAVRGRVARGRGEGHKMGFPTANVVIDSSILAPQEGVYAGFACLGEEAWPAAINVGLPPTFKGVPGSAELEANIVGFSADIYERDIALSFTKQLRRSRPFDSLDELIATVEGNIQDVRDLYGEGRYDLRA